MGDKDTTSTWDSDLYTRLAHGGLWTQNGRMGCL
jgi:hypothetical protein